MPNKTALFQLGVESVISTIDISRSGDWFVFGCPQTNQLLVWEWKSERFILNQKGNMFGAQSLAYSHDGKYIAAGRLTAHWIFSVLTSRWEGWGTENMESGRWILLRLVFWCDILFRSLLFTYIEIIPLKLLTFALSRTSKLSWLLRWMVLCGHLTCFAIATSRSSPVLSPGNSHVWQLISLAKLSLLDAWTHSKYSFVWRYFSTLSGYFSYF